jgi:2-iminobutanoate/2-iminopropanoate deaminase
MITREIVEPVNTALNVSRNFKLPHSPCVRAGDLLFVSGMVSIDPETGQVRRGSIEDETRQVLNNMKHLLESAGRTMRDVIKTNIFIYDIAEMDNCVRVYQTFFPVDPPASTICGVQLSFDLKVEIECIAIA